MSSSILDLFRLDGRVALVTGAASASAQPSLTDSLRPARR